MRAVTFQAPGEVRLEEKPEPEIGAADDALVQVEASGICGSDLHIYHGRVPVEPGFTIGHEFVGRVLAAGPQVERVSAGDRVLGCFHTACATCAACLREGVIEDADLLDGALVFATGFAPFRGGPLHYARSRGVPDIRQALERLQAKRGPRFAPDPGWSALEERR